MCPKGQRHFQHSLAVKRSSSAFRKSTISPSDTKPLFGAGRAAKMGANGEVNTAARTVQDVRADTIVVPLCRFKSRGRFVTSLQLSIDGRRAHLARELGQCSRVTPPC
jgi:hypothetical protein